MYIEFHDSFKVGRYPVKAIVSLDVIFKVINGAISHATCTVYIFEGVAVKFAQPIVGSYPYKSFIILKNEVDIIMCQTLFYSVIYHIQVSVFLSQE